MPNPDLDIFYKRWQALDKQIMLALQNYAQPASANGNPGFPRQAAILSLLTSLREFAAGQFQFFYYGFEPKERVRNNADPLLQTWDDFPPEDILTGILVQIAHDLATIQRVAEQRRSADKDTRIALDAADKLAWIALQPAIRHKIIDAPTMVLTYFEKASEFYSIPYEKVALISMPLTCMMSDSHRDYLAIAHEAGHYVFRHLVSQARLIIDRLPQSLDIPKEYQDWIKAVFEEMCADIYGCLVAGPVMARDFSELSLQNSQDSFSKGDDSHPNPALRPLIYCLVLANQNVKRLSRDDWQSISRKLADCWDDKLRERHVDTFVIKSYRIEGDNRIPESQRQVIADDIKPLASPAAVDNYGILGNVIKVFVDTLIDSLLAYLVSTGQPDPYDLSGWAGPIDANTQPDDLFDKYENWYRLNVLDDQPPPAPVPPPAPIPPFPVDLPFPVEPPIPAAPLQRDLENHTTQLWFNVVQPLNPTIVLTSSQTPILSGEVKNAIKTKPGTWGFILWSDGWTTEGPGIDHGQPAL